MYAILGRIFRYILWLILIVIMLLLFVGLAKNDRNVIGYIQTLNQRSRSEAWQEGGISGIFRGTNTGTGVENLSTNTGNVESNTGNEDSGASTGIDVFDPNFEQDLNQASQDDLTSGDYSDAETGYGFVTDNSGTVVPATGSVTASTTGDSNAQLLELMKQREMNK